MKCEVNRPLSLHIMHTLNSLMQAHQQMEWLMHKTSDSLQKIAGDLESHKRSSAAEHSRLSSEVMSALERIRISEAEKREEMRREMLAQVQRLEMVRKYQTIFV